MNTSEYLDAAQKALQVKSDNALANTLGLNRTAISHYRTGRNAFDNRTAFIIANALGIDPLEVIRDMEIQRAKDEKTRSFWMNMKPLIQHGIHASVLAATGIAIVISKAVNELALLTS
ncbi:hypothetical protein AZSI13_07730 [Azospira sp. I13]|uniref:helix-turn-helix domain-containing protein n=1 Tax=Azospira sp. I13 TaxID=1765050 RepID=UPI000D470A3F|nr:helix-turn-helix domain-containing protein [Azospira sp. I13]GBG01446.1 hypothetical protein AZSI13_07730 [Azospira sp. I13]